MVNAKITRKFVYTKVLDNQQTLSLNRCRLYMSGLAGCGDRAADMDGSGNRTPDIESSVSRSDLFQNFNLT